MIVSWGDNNNKLLMKGKYNRLFIYLKYSHVKRMENTHLPWMNILGGYFAKNILRNIYVYIFR